MNNQIFNSLLTTLQNKLGARVKEFEPLAKYTTMKIGGPARFYVEVKKIEELILVIKEARNYRIPFFILGGGTNLLVSDKGFDGLVIKNNISKITIKKYGVSLLKKKILKKIVAIEASSGVSVNQLVRFTLDEGLTGLEAFLGQPGTVGGAIYINAHNIKMGEFFGEKIVSSKILAEDGEIREVGRSYFKFGYDESILQKRKEVVLSVTIQLEKGDNKTIWEKANLAMSHRKNSQPLGSSSSGCIFRNISRADALRLGIPYGITSVGYLIEAVGLKGVKHGEVQFSPKHANFIINLGQAKTADINFLISLAKKKVKERFGITLKEEIVRL